MQRPISTRALSRLQGLAVALILAGSVAVVLGAARYGDRAYLIVHRPDAPWITAPQPEARAKAIYIDREKPPGFVFERGFRLAAVPERAVVTLRALREVQLLVNGQPVPLPGRVPRRWKRATSVDVAAQLRPGENRLTAHVFHRNGPTLLQLWSADLGGAVATGPGWTVASAKSGLRSGAVVAKDVRRYPYGERLPSPARVLRERAPVLAVVFLLCALPAWLRVPLPRWLAGRHWPRTAFALVAVFWLSLFVSKAMHFPNFLGFDGEGHAAYVDFVAKERRLPRADERWEAFQPPLYHASAAGLRLLAGTERGTPLDRALVHLLPMLAGLGCAWLAGRTARSLAPDSPGAAAVAVLAAGLLPMHLYMSSFASNESVHTFFVSAALWLSCEQLAATRADARRLAGVSALLGLALLAKSTSSAPIALLVAALLGLKLWLVEARPAGRALGTGAALLLGPLLLSGWFYLRNWLLFDDPFVSNLNFREWTYWIPPGFHTPAWFLGFGEVLRQPFFASFASYADGLYSSFWGDGYASGRAGVKFPNPWWDYESMAAVYPLALPATALLGLGVAVCTARALRGAATGRRLGWSLLVVVAYGMSLMLLLTTFRIPFNAMPKAFYTLPSLVPLAVAFAQGVGFLYGLSSGVGQRLIRALLLGYLGVLSASIAVAFLG